MSQSKKYWDRFIAFLKPSFPDGGSDSVKRPRLYSRDMSEKGLPQSEKVDAKENFRILLEILGLIALVVTIGLLFHQNELIREANTKTDSALAITRAQLSNDSIHDADLDRPWVYLESRSVSAVADGRKQIIMKFANTGKTAAYNLSFKYCLDMTFSEKRNFGSCRVGWSEMKGMNLPPQGWLEIPYDFPIPRTREVNGVPYDERVYIYGYGKYEKKTDSDTGFVEFCLEFFPRQEGFWGCKGMLGRVL